MSWLPITKLTSPASEPVTLDEVKAQCRISSDDEDSLLAIYIAAARQFVEHYTGTRLVSQSVEMRGECFSDLAYLPVAPLIAITSIKYLDPDGIEQTLSTDVYEAVLIGLHPSVRLKVNQTWPAIRDVRDAVRVVATAGYGELPEPVRQAVLLTVATWFESREVGAIPSGAIGILGNYRRES